MNWWKIIKKTFEYKPNTDREGFVLKETSQEKEQLAREQNPCHGKEGKGNDEAQKRMRK